MKISDIDYSLNIELSEKLGTLSLASGELVYCSANERDIKDAIISKLNLGQMELGQIAKTKDEIPLKKKLSLIFPELIFMNNLNVEENLNLFFEARNLKINNNHLKQKLSEFNISPSKPMNSLSLVEKIDFLICRTFLANLKIIVLDSTILQLNEYDQDRIMAELIMHCREHGASLIVTKYSERLINSFPGRVHQAIAIQNEAESKVYA